MVQKRRRGLQCPSCHNHVTASKLIFREGVRCARCGSVLQVCAAYGRTLLLLSIMIAFLLLWMAGVRDVVRFCLFWIPTAFVVLTVAVRVAAPLLPPRLIVGQRGHINTLGLGDDKDNRHDES
jgi:hypothetical protein